MLLSANLIADERAPTGPFQATGFKVGEVTDTSAIVWTRLTARPQRNPSDGPDVTIEYDRSDDNESRRERAVSAVIFENNVTVRDLREAVPGIDGETRVRVRPVGTNADWQTTKWQAVDSMRDFTGQFHFRYLEPNTIYEAQVESRSLEGQVGETQTGGFRTAPSADDAARVVFTVSTGQGNNDQDRPDGFNIYPEMLKLDPSFFVHTGDIVYYDGLAKTVELARYHWQRTYSWPTNVEFHNNVGSYFMKDDHDTWKNDCWPSMKSPYMHEFTFQQGLAIFREQVPMGDKTFRTRRWGKDLQVWMVEGRDFRSPNTMPDGPGKTIWGLEQIEWFLESFQNSDATFRILISPTPIVGPDRQNKKDNHSNAVFAHEGDQLRGFLSEQKNVFTVCGDRHWQYVSVDPRTGVREYSCGPASDKHANGWSQEDYIAEYHRYLNVIGGFLSVTVERANGEPTIAFRHYSAQGDLKHEDVFTANTGD